MSDEKYKKALIQELNLNLDDYHKLDAIVGPNEFETFLRNHQNNPLAYAQTDDFTNVREGNFRANFHIHTTNSDGLMKVEDLLNLAEEYGQSLTDKKGEKFYFAITDHNTVNGTKEALNLLIENPSKYQHIGLVLGIEASAMFTSEHTHSCSEVHLLSYAINPFEDEIAQLNQHRLNVFQDGINKALHNANVYYAETINTYGIEFNFEDMAKIRSSIKTCPSNVRYSMKDYLQFRLIYADLVENNWPLKKYLLENGVSLNKLNFAEPKDMIINGEKRPYWLNYIDMLKIYLEKQMVNSKYASHHDKINNLIPEVSDKLKEILENMEHTVLNPESDMYIREPKPLTFEEVTHAFATSKTAISGIAHGAYYEQNNPQRKLFLQDLYKNFKEQLPTQTIIGEKHYPYPAHIDTKFTDGLIDLYGYIPSGGLDSHKNNFFTPQTSYSKSFLEEIMGKKTLSQGDSMRVSANQIA